MEAPYWAKVFLTLGIIFIIIGIMIWLLPRFPILNRLGHLPGDIVYRRGNFVFYFPLVTCLLLSVILTLVFTFIFRR